MQKLWLVAIILGTPITRAEAHDEPQRMAAPAKRTQTAEPEHHSPDMEKLFDETTVTTIGSVRTSIGRLAYRAMAGRLVVHPSGWDDSADASGTATAEQHAGSDGQQKASSAVAAISYVAYFKTNSDPRTRPITFLYNGGPGSSSMWLHMGAFGPRRVITADHEHTPAAPYTIVDNTYSLLDVSDLVFIDAPGTGFSRIAGPDKEKAFFGVDADAYAFRQFILKFLSRFRRWNSPKYLLGESYGTPRSAILVDQLETQDNVDFNGVILLSQILNFSLNPDAPENEPGSDEAYVVALPAYAATAWYHHRLSTGGDRDGDASFQAFLRQVEHFAATDYAAALQAGSELDAGERRRIADKIAFYTGLTPAYVMRANLRISGGEFQKSLLGSAGLTTGRLDTRFSGPTMDPMSRGAEYDPQEAAISSAYVSAFNEYVRDELKFGGTTMYRPFTDVFSIWDFAHKPPGGAPSFPGATNAMPDLANALKYNPRLKVLVAGGYFDVATPYYEGWYEMHHLAIPESLQGNIEYHYYPSGHMVYAQAQSLARLHGDIAAFIRSTSISN
jgi:carboxypeptidase C (cathepsin A)